jgi:hypothetical protein
MEKDADTLTLIDEPPAEFIVPSRLVLTRLSFERVVEQVMNAEPTPALRELMSDGE